MQCLSFPLKCLGRRWCPTEIRRSSNWRLLRGSGQARSKSSQWGNGAFVKDLSSLKFLLRSLFWIKIRSIWAFMTSEWKFLPGHGLPDSCWEPCFSSSKSSLQNLSYIDIVFPDLPRSFRPVLLTAPSHYPQSSRLSNWFTFSSEASLILTAKFYFLFQVNRV